MQDKTLSEKVAEAFSPGNIPEDLLLLYAWTLLTVLAIYIPLISTSPLRIILALPMILFFPGYALIGALFPTNHDIDGVERIALSFGLSIAIVPLIGLVLNYTPLGIRLDPVVISLVAFTLVMSVIAQYRRSSLPRSERFIVDFKAIAGAAKAEMFSPSLSRTDRMLSVILVLAVTAAIATTVYVVVIPKEGEKFTEFYILGKEGKAADYPTEVRAGAHESVIIGIANHEYRNMTYGVEVLLLEQQFDPSTNTSVITRAAPVSGFYVNLTHNATYQEALSFTTNETGYNQIKFLLYRDEIPAAGIPPEERINRSYRDLHLWLSIRPR